MVVGLLLEGESGVVRVISPLVYQTPPQSISGSHQLFSVCVLLIFLRGCWISCVMATILPGDHDSAVLL